MDSGVPPTPPQQYAVAGRIPLAVVVVDGEGLVSHRSTGARRLFGSTREEAVGRPAVDLLPVTGALADYGEYDSYDGYGGLGPGLDASLNGRDESVERMAPGFALHTEFPGFDELARRLPEILPSMSVHESTRIVSQVLDLGYPVLEFSHHDRVPVTPDWGVPRPV